MSKILKITQTLRQQFIDGHFRDMHQFMSVRALAAQYGVSINSANKILQSLEDLGFLISVPKSGFFVKHTPAIKSVKKTARPIFCANPLIKNRASQIRSWAEMVSTQASVRLDLATASPDFYPTHQLQTLHNRLARHHPSMLTEYAIGGGFPPLRAQVAQQYNAVGCDLTVDDVLITHGATQALMLALQASTQAGDWVLIEAPTYFGFLPLLDSLQLHAVEMPIDVNMGLQPADIQAALKHAANKGHTIRACLLQANFHNPTGASIAHHVRRELLDVCAAHEIAVIEDDTFGALPHVGAQRAAPLKALDTQHNVILCGSLSKLIAPGLRIGFVAGGRWAESIKALQHATAIACATLPQAVLSEFMHSNYKAYLKKMRQVCQQSIAMARKIVSETFPKGTTMSAPQGGYLLWVILPAHCNAQKLLDAAMAQHGIAFAHGGLFSNLSAQQSSLRLNCALMAQSHEQEGLQKLGQIAEQMFGVKN